MSNDQVCDCGHPVSFHKPKEGIRSSPCTWLPPKSKMRCACSHPTTTGTARDDTYTTRYDIGPQDQVRLRGMSDADVRVRCRAVLLPGANVYAATSESWQSLARSLAYLLLQRTRPEGKP